MLASRLADGAVVKPVETAVRYGADRSAPRPEVFLSSEGDVVSCSVASSAGVDGSSEEQRPARRSGTSGPLLVDFFAPSKRHKSSKAGL